MTLYAFSGIGANDSVFNNLDLDCNVIVISYISPKPIESPADYTKRLFGGVVPSGNFGFLGLSFGGVIATEAAKLFKPRFLILISSIRTKDDLPIHYRLLGKSGLLNKFNADMLKGDNPLAGMFLGPNKKGIINYLASKAEDSFIKWALQSIVGWDNTAEFQNTLMISGSDDRILPHSSKKSHQVIIQGGGHFMIYDRPDEISRHINEYIRQLSLAPQNPQTR